MPRLAAWLLPLAVMLVRPAFGQQPPQQPGAYDRPVSFRTLIPNIGDDQAGIWRSPVELRHKRVWIPVAMVLGTAAALIAADPRDTPYFRRTNEFNSFNHVMTSTATAAGIAAAPAALLAFGVFDHNPKATSTALLTAEAVADSWVVGTVLKDIFMRQRPSQTLPNGNFSDTWFEHRTSLIDPNGGMPSGHTLYAFAVATVVARRYGNHKWVPYMAYGLATAVALSRVTGTEHFLSDVFVGGVLGYSIGRFAVLRQ